MVVNILYLFFTAVPIWNKFEIVTKVWNEDLLDANSDLFMTYKAEIEKAVRMD